MVKVAVPIELNRAGGALCALTVSAWPKGGQEATVPTDTAVLENFKVAQEHATLSLPPGTYRVACLVDIIEAVSGTFNYRYTVGKEGGKGEGDVNKTPKKDVRSFIKTFDLTVQ